MVCLQDVRVREYKVINDARFCPVGFVPFYFEGEDEEKGGVAIFTRHTPKAVMRGLGSYDLIAMADTFRPISNTLALCRFFLHLQPVMQGNYAARSSNR